MNQSHYILVNGKETAAFKLFRADNSPAMKVFSAQKGVQPLVRYHVIFKDWKFNFEVDPQIFPRRLDLKNIESITFHEELIKGLPLTQVLQQLTISGEMRRLRASLADVSGFDFANHQDAEILTEKKRLLEIQLKNRIKELKHQLVDDGIITRSITSYEVDLKWPKDQNHEEYRLHLGCSGSGTLIDGDNNYVEELSKVEAAEVNAVHGVDLNEFREEIDKLISQGKDKRANTSRRNGRKGGRPIMADSKNLSLAIKAVLEMKTSFPDVKWNRCCKSKIKQYELAIEWQALMMHVRKNPVYQKLKRN